MTTNNYASLADVKSSLPLNEAYTTATWDVVITDEISEQSREFDTSTNREPGAYYVNADSVRYFDGPGYGSFNSLSGMRSQRLTSGNVSAITLRIGELAAAPTEVAMAQTAAIATAGGSGTYTVVPATDYYLTPSNALQFNHPYQRIELDIVNGTTAAWLPFRRGIRVTGKFGYSTAVPDDVRKCVKLMVIRALRKSQQNYLDVGTILDSGQIMSGAKIDDDISRAIKRYRRMAI